MAAGPVATGPAAIGDQRSGGYLPGGRDVRVLVAVGELEVVQLALTVADDAGDEPEPLPDAVFRTPGGRKLLRQVLVREAADRFDQGVEGVLDRGLRGLPVVGGRRE